MKRKHGVLEEEDFEGKYRQKLADYKAYQEKEFQARLEKAVEEAIGSVRQGESPYLKYYKFLTDLDVDN